MDIFLNNLTTYITDIYVIHVQIIDMYQVFSIIRYYKFICSVWKFIFELTIYSGIQRMILQFISSI